MATKILITGGAGYVGSILCERLLAEGYEVTALDKLIFNQMSILHLIANPKFTFVKGDVRDEKLVKELVAKADYVIPLAAMVGAPVCDAEPYLAQTINHDAISLINKVRSKSQGIIYPMTNSGYGSQTGDGFCTEETPLEPISHYGRTKVAAESEVLNSGNAISFRLATVFGVSPRMRLDLMVNNFVYLAATQKTLVLFEKHFRRNFVHVRDVADCFTYALKNFGAMSGKPYNLGQDSANMTKAELAETIKKYVPGLYIHYAEIGTDPDKRDYVVSNDRLRKAGFEASRSIDDGIKELLVALPILPKDNLRNY